MTQTLGRLAALLIILAELLLLAVVREPSGTTAIWFSFVGHAILGLGIVLALVVIARRARGAEQPPVG